MVDRTYRDVDRRRDRDGDANSLDNNFRLFARLGLVGFLFSNLAEAGKKKRHLERINSRTKAGGLGRQINCKIKRYNYWITPSL